VKMLSWAIMNWRLLFGGKDPQKPDAIWSEEAHQLMTTSVLRTPGVRKLQSPKFGLVESWHGGVERSNL
jgi:hypothetical protein